MWDAATGAALVTLRGHSRVVSSTAFSPDGNRVVTASFDKTARVWQLPPRCQALIDAVTAPAPAGMPRLLSEAQREENFLKTRPPGPFIGVFAAVRPIIAWLLPSAGDKCE
jgi:hypothetical protein